MQPTKVAVIGSGAVGTDLLMKVLHGAPGLEMAALIGIDPDSPGLAQAAELGIPTSSRGLAGLLAMPHFAEIELVFDATTTGAHRANVIALAERGKRIVHLTQSALGVRVVPGVNLDAHVGAGNINVLTGSAQATVPLVAAIVTVTPVLEAVVDAVVAGAGARSITRDRIAAVTDTTAHALTAVGGARSGRASVSPDRSDPPRAPVTTLRAAVGELDRRGRAAVTAAVREAASRVACYSPGFRLTGEVAIEQVRARTDEVTVGLELTGAGAHLPVHAGNLDLMTAAAVRIAERVAVSAAR
ncbi:Gfo/Idh/MocA family oxidoreductase [Nocardia harenae]|uniref:Gfo/Idh/MocA family oxidoreductase n=1 Tax=Nocardia harenae TaxID=358707 RepID=UPI00082CF6D7|nr:Gfo/Idh/MocA family oxidoreductase [Nocardia harenae]